MTEDEGTTSSFEVYKSPTEKLKNEIIRLLMENINHNSKSRKNPDETYAFITKTKDLSVLIERYTGRTAKKELLQWYKQLDNKIKEMKEAKDVTITSDKLEDKILVLKYQYALQVHNQNTKIIMNSPIIEIEVEGELDISDEDIVGIVRLREKRKDDGKLEFKH